MSSVQIARYLISFSWFYHGLVPKLLHIAPLEKLMTASFGFADDISYVITKVAGISEILFAVVFFIFYRSTAVVVLNIMALMGLLGFVAALQPQLLMEAFNPVTTNLTLIGLSLVLLNEIKSANKPW